MDNRTVGSVGYSKLIKERLMSVNMLNVNQTSLIHLTAVNIKINIR